MYCHDMCSRLHVAARPPARAVTCFATPSMGLETATPGMDRKRSLSPVTVTRIRVETVRYQPCAGEAAGADDWATLQLFIDVACRRVAAHGDLIWYKNEKKTE